MIGHRTIPATFIENMAGRNKPQLFIKEADTREYLISHLHFWMRVTRHCNVKLVIYLYGLPCMVQWLHKMHKLNYQNCKVFHVLSEKQSCNGSERVNALTACMCASIHQSSCPYTVWQLWWNISQSFVIVAVGSTPNQRPFKVKAFHAGEENKAGGCTHFLWLFPDTVSRKH